MWGMLCVRYVRYVLGVWGVLGVGCTVKEMFWVCGVCCMLCVK